MVLSPKGQISRQRIKTIYIQQASNEDMKTYIYFVLCFALLGCAQTAKSDDLIEVEDSSLILLLNNVETVVDRRKFPFRLRVFRLRELGECDGPPPRCPTEVLYVAVSTYDEAPDQRLYVLPTSYGWHFDHWSNWPTSDDASEFVVFALTARELATEGSDTTISQQKYIVRVNTKSGSISPIGSD